MCDCTDGYSKNISYRLERMKNEYRSLKTWHDKADYLDQLILKRGPKTRAGQAKKYPNTPHYVSSMYLEVPAPVPSREDTDSDMESEQVAKPSNIIGTTHIIPALSITSSTSCSPGSSDGGDNLKGKVIRETIRRASETSISSGITAEFSETGDSESIPQSGTKSKAIPKEPPDVEKKKSTLEYLPELPIQ
ncbi:C2 calcium-dependent domain-containing protein 6, partial [Varanus komodoensis]